MDLVEADSDAITRKESYFRLSGRGIVQGIAVRRPSRECLESQSVRRHHTDLVAVNVIKNQIRDRVLNLKLLDILLVEELPCPVYRIYNHPLLRMPSRIDPS